MSHTHKMVDGVEVALTQSEVDEFNSRDVSFDALEADREINSLRQKRDILLVESDWTQVPDYNSPTKAAWATYRQALRDLPNNTADPVAFMAASRLNENGEGPSPWPVKPE